MNKILSMAALALIMAGCSNDDEKIVIDNGSEVANAVPVQIMQKVAGVETKAAVTLGSTMKANIIMVDEGNSVGNPDFAAFIPKTQNDLIDDGKDGKKLDTDANRATVANAEFTAASDAGEIKLNPTLYYPLTNTTATWLIGVAPQGTVDNTKVTFSVADGSQDVMYAVKQSAGDSKSDKKVPELEFRHQTTQLLFVAKLTNADLSNTEWKDKTISVQNIIIKKAGVPTSINIQDGTINCADKDITVKGCAVALGKDPCPKSDPVMIKESASVIVDIVLSVGTDIVTYSDLTVKASDGNKLATHAGKSHLITFEITPPVTASDGVQIGAKAKIVDWTTGEAGKVEIK